MIYDNQNGAFVGDFVFTKVPFVGSPKNTPWSREKNELRGHVQTLPQTTCLSGNMSMIMTVTDDLSFESH